MKQKKGTVLFTAIILGLAFFAILQPVAGTLFSALFGTGITILPFLPLEKGLFGMNSTNNFSARESYRIAKELLYNSMRNDPAFQNMGGDRACRDWVNGRKLSQSEIRLEVELNTANNSFIFGLTANQQNTTNIIFPTENRLQMQDSLIVSEYGFFVANPASRTDTAFQIKTYGSQPTFAAAAANALNSTLYGQGNFRLTCNNDVIMPYRGLFNHWYRPQTQQTAAFGAASPEDQVRGAEDGFITAEPNILLIGSKGYQPQIVLPGNLASVDTFERGILIFRGILAQNSTSVS